MGNHAALVIACAALGAVILQAAISWTPENSTSSAAGHLGSGAPAAAALGSTNLVPHESRDSTPNGWANLGAADGSRQLSMRIALTSQDAAGLQKAVMDVSTPGNAKYGKHLNAVQVNNYLAPSPAAQQAVTAWLASEGISTQTQVGHGDWLGFTTNVSQASRLFDASFATYHHVGSGTQHIRTLAYSIPAHLKPHVDIVHPMTSFAVPKPHRSVLDIPVTPSRFWSSRQTTGTSDCTQQITPACVQQIYGLPSKSVSFSANSIVVTGYSNQFPQDADLQLFLKQFRPDMSPATSFVLQKIDGGRDDQNASEAGLEANLDIQYTVGIASGVPISFLSVGNDDGGAGLEGFLDSVNFVASQDIISTVMSTSYDFIEANLPPALMQKVCNAYAALGAQGTSLFFASGDGGVSGPGNPVDNTCTDFVPTFPSTCPFVTSVGATTGVPETAAALSAGGFSNVFPVPDYQASVVQSYLSTLGNTFAGRFNTSGRGFPDVAAYGQNVQVFTGGQLTPVDGTSCATPIFASTIALLNDQLVAAGKSPLGFLNPWLYQNPGALNDITAGSNPGCGTDGFPAVAGWDPLTGLGSPNFAALLAATGTTLST